MVYVEKISYNGHHTTVLVRLIWEAWYQAMEIKKHNYCTATRLECHWFENRGRDI